MTSTRDLSHRLDVLEHALHIARQQRDPAIRTRWLTAIQAATTATRHDLATATPDEETRPRPTLHLVEQFTPAASEVDQPHPDRTPDPATWWAEQPHGRAPRP